MTIQRQVENAVSRMNANASNKNPPSKTSVHKCGSSKTKTGQSGASTANSMEATPPNLRMIVEVKIAKPNPYKI